MFQTVAATLPYQSGLAGESFYSGESVKLGYGIERVMVLVGRGEPHGREVEPLKLSEISTSSRDTRDVFRAPVQSDTGNKRTCNRQGATTLKQLRTMQAYPIPPWSCYLLTSKPPTSQLADNRTIETPTQFRFLDLSTTCGDCTVHRSSGLSPLTAALQQTGTGGARPEAVRRGAGYNGRARMRDPRWPGENGHSDNTGHGYLLCGELSPSSTFPFADLSRAGKDPTFLYPEDHLVY
ncbi:hypothetical protein RRG08_038634 [Elysia crispata]|uniref:Uncharacterized protein n=1 Tax=Elysia crispata TaxID=231223 RepID=A0AAE0YLJ3_9GAST|nr:hypothetical protein RRG08_038634 [Elysia crispata]